MKITFCGAAQEVTGSKYLVEYTDTRILVDCGLFQGNKELTKHNWDSLPISPETIDALVITHGHIDHIGYIPVLVKNGFRGPIYCSRATQQMSVVLLLDSGVLQEEEAKKHDTMPLYTKEDAEYALNFFKPVDYDVVIHIKSLQVRLIRSGHILGSAFVIVDNGKQTLAFSGDLGRPDQPILKAPPFLKEADYLVLESTYGSREHDEKDPEQMLSDAIDETVKKGGVLLIPCFSVMRTQTVLYYLYLLKQKKDIPNIPIFLDSPSAISITNFFCNFADEYSLSPATCKAALSIATDTPTVEESKRIDHLDQSAIIIAGSGMVDGGRMPFHVEHYISDAKNTILFVGYQAKGSTGRYIVDGANEIRMNKKEYPIRATIKSIRSLSAHADMQEILTWLEHFEKFPKKIFLIHGEVQAMLILKKSIEERFNVPVVIPSYLESFDLAE